MVYDSCLENSRPRKGSAGSNPAPSAMGFVYKWTNVVNDHWYVGSHAGDEDDGYVGSGVAFRLAYAKYGVENFKREILYRGDDFKKVERQILTELDARNDSSSYNLINESWEGFLGRRHTPQTLTRFSEIKSGVNNPMYGRRGEKSPTYGKRGFDCQSSKLNPEQVNEIRALLATHNNRQIAQLFNVSRHTISRVRRGITTGNVAERLKAPASKAGGPVKGPVGSNPTVSAFILKCFSTFSVD